MNNLEYVQTLLIDEHFYRGLVLLQETEESCLFGGRDSFGFAVIVKVDKTASVCRDDWYVYEQDENDPPEYWAEIGTLLP